VVQDAGYFDVELHPQHERNGWIYLAYAAPQGERASMTRIVRGRLRDGAWRDEEVVYEPPAGLYGDETVHYGCRLLFDAAGRLLFTIGDRGQPERAQDPSSPLGKIHRVTEDGGVPGDNPFATHEAVVPTIWSLGHRNPQGLSFDPDSGALWEAEHGPVGGDELNVIEKGHNYGWARISHGLDSGVARISGGRAPGAERVDGMELAVHYWTPAIAPSGIHFYSGVAYPRWRGHLFVTGLGGTALRRVEVKGRQVVGEEVLFDRFGRVRDVITGPDHLLYVAVQTPGDRLSSATPGLVIRLVPVD
jgi:glucose/arabinose dehydrogenase